MKLDFNETNILVQVLAWVEKNPKVNVNKTKIIEALYALHVHTDKRYIFLRLSIKSLIAKIERLSDDDIVHILDDNKNSKIVASVCYEIPDGVSRRGR